MSYHCIKYETLYKGVINFSIDGSAYLNCCSEIHRQEVFKKMACFEGDALRYRYSPTEKIVRTCQQKQWKAQQNGVKIYVDPKCRTPRDLFRQSKYKIVRNPDDADVYVVPSIKDRYFYMTFNVAAQKDDKLYLFNVVYNRNQIGNSQDERIDEAHCESLRNKLDECGMQILTEDPNCKRYCYFLPRYDIYKEVLCNERPDRAYCQETFLHIDYPTTINLETLLLWSKYSVKDTEALRKAILVSNWRDYPYTLLTFIEKTYNDLAYNPDPQFKLVLDTIGYDCYNCFTEECSGKIISPEDWNLAQEFFLVRVGLPKEGGYVSLDDYRSSDYDDLVRTKIVVAPLKIDKPMLYDDLHEMLN